jgi:ribose-phosphate pyrophosphokinase
MGIHAARNFIHCFHTLGPPRDLRDVAVDNRVYSPNPHWYIPPRLAERRSLQVGLLSNQTRKYRRSAKPMMVVACNSNRPLAEAVAAYLNIPLTAASIRRFADLEVFVEIQENVRGEDVFVVQSTSYPANDNLMELLVSIDALKRASARRITAVLPYFGYARQDRKPGPRTPISAKLVANLLTTAGANRVLTLDLHAGQIQGFFDIPTDNLISAPVIVKDIEEQFDGDDLMIVSPDVGGVIRARAVAKRLDLDLAIVDKRREREGVSEVMNIIGDVSGRRCILIDDIVDSAGTLCNAADALRNEGAMSVVAYVTHGVLSGGAIARVASSSLETLVTTDSIVATEAVRVSNNIRRLTIASLMAEAMLRISQERSVSSLFN